jgi:hypothetical protein
MREVRALLRSNGIVWNPSVEEALAKYDTDGDGEISRAEFDGLYKHLRSMQAAAAAKAEAAGEAGGDDAEAAAEARRAHFAQVKEKTVKQQQELDRKRVASRAKNQASTEATQATTAGTAAAQHELESVESLRDLWKESEAEMEALQWELKQAEQLARQQVLREKGAKHRLRARRTMTEAVQAFVQNPAYRRYGSRARALVPQCLKRAEFSGAENAFCCANSLIYSRYKYPNLCQDRLGTNI